MDCRGYLFLASQRKRSGIYPRKIPLPLLSGRLSANYIPRKQRIRIPSTRRRSMQTQT